MQIKEISQTGLQHNFQITIPSDVIEQKIEIRYKELSKKAKISGFRPGKIPMNVMASRYESTVRPEILRTAIDDAVKQLISEKNLRSAMQPQVDIDSYEDKQDLVCTVKVELLPTIPAIDLKTLTGDHPVAAVNDTQTNRYMEMIASNNKTLQPLSELRPTQLGDTVKIDFDGSTNDGPIKGGSGKNFDLELGSGQFIPGFEDQLVGWSLNDSKDIHVNFPENYNAKELAGQQATFKVTLHGISSSVLPEFNDEFAIKVGFKSIDELRQHLQASLKLENDKMSFHAVKKLILDQLNNIQIELPQNLVRHEFDLIKNEYLKDQQGHNNHVHTENCNHESHVTELDEQLSGELQVLAERRVRLGLILAEIGKLHNVEVTREEIQAALTNQARQYPGQEKSVFDYFQKNTQAMQSLRAPIYEDKVIGVILKESAIQDKQVDLGELEKIIKEITQDDTN